MPTTSAPACFASSAFAPWANTATRTFLPLPFGSTVEPRTDWSDFDASMPRLIATSTDSTNFAFASSLTSLSASSTGYALPGVSFSAAALRAFVTCAMTNPPPRGPCSERCPR